PQAVPAFDGKSAGALAIEEAAKHRLQHVLGIDLGTEGRVQLLTGQSHDSAGKAIEYPRCCVVVTRPEVFGQSVKWFGRRHPLLMGRWRGRSSIMTDAMRRMQGSCAACGLAFGTANAKPQAAGSLRPFVFQPLLPRRCGVTQVFTGQSLETDARFGR